MPSGAAVYMSFKINCGMLSSLVSKPFIIAISANGRTTLLIFLAMLWTISNLSEPDFFPQRMYKPITESFSFNGLIENKYLNTRCSNCFSLIFLGLENLASSMIYLEFDSFEIFIM